MTQPPRRRPRVLHEAPRQPYPPATDLDPPVDVEEEPIPLTSEYVPTMRDLSEQIGAVDRRVAAVHREAALTRSEVADLRALVTTDHAPRITEVEKRVPITIPPGLRKGALYTVLVSVYPVVEALWPLARELLQGK